MRHKQIVLQPGLAPNQHVNCYSLKPAKRYTPDSQTHHHAQAAKQTCVGGGLFAPCLWMSFLTTVKTPRGRPAPSSKQQTHRLMCCCPAWSSATSLSQPGLGQTHRVPLPAAAQQPASKSGLSICMCTAYPAQQGQNKTCLLLSAARLGF